MAHINHTPARNGKSAAVCCCCDKHSRPARTDSKGEPDLWDMAQGWSQAPYPADFLQSDGTIGSTYTCPACNKRMRAGETLRLRSGASIRHLE